MLCRERLPAGSRSCIAGPAKRAANGYFGYDIGAPQGPRGGVVTQRSAKLTTAVPPNSSACHFVNVFAPFARSRAYGHPFPSRLVLPNSVANRVAVVVRR